MPKLSAHFSQFGEVHHAVIKHPAAGSTERTRSFGFISTSSRAANVILQTTHIIDGRNVGTPEIAKQRRQEPSFDPSALHSMDSRGNMPNSAIMGWEPSIMGGSAAPLEARKIFVGGLSHQTKESALASYFSQFGPISDVVVMTEGTARRPRGFGFVTFEEPAAVELVIRSRFHPIEGRLVEVKPAVSREQMRQQMAVSPEYGIGGGAGALTAGVGGPPLGGVLPQLTLNTMGNYPPGAEIPAGTMMPSNTNTYPAGAMPAGLYPPPQTDAVVSGGAYDPTGEQGVNVGGAPPGAWYPGGAGPQGPTMYPPPPMGPHAGPHPGPPHAFYPHSIPAGVPVYVGYGSPEMQYTNMAAAAGGMGGVHGMGGIPPNYTNMPPNANIGGGGGGGGGVGAQVPSAAPMAAAGGPNLYRTQQMPPQGNINAGQATNPNPNNTAAAGPQQQPAMIPPSLQQQGGPIPTQPMTPAGPHHLAAGPPQGMQMMMMMPTAATTTNAPPPGSPPHGAGGGYAPQGHWVPAGGPPLHPSQMAPHPQPQGPQMMMMVAPQGGVGGGYPAGAGGGGGGGGVGCSRRSCHRNSSSRRATKTQRVQLE